MKLRWIIPHVLVVQNKVNQLSFLTIAAAATCFLALHQGQSQRRIFQGLLIPSFSS
jgi:hypothetical protein